MVKHSINQSLISTIHGRSGNPGFCFRGARRVVAVVSTGLLIGCATVPRYTRTPGREIPSVSTKSPPTHRDIRIGHYSETGMASYYAGKFQGRKTASGERYDGRKMTAAHRTLPFNTYVKVTNDSNDKSVIVKINDRGPHIKNRIIDLSYDAAKTIGLVSMGTGRVRIEVVKSE